MFTCETVGGSLIWVVNGTQREIHPAEIRRDLVVSETITDNGTILENLTIPARAEYNGTRVQCFVAIFGGSTVQSDNATLWIQGYFNPPDKYIVLYLEPTVFESRILIGQRAGSNFHCILWEPIVSRGNL